MTALLDSIQYADWALHVLIWLPIVGLLHVLRAPEDRAGNVALLWSLVVFILSIGLWWAHEPGTAAMQLASSHAWIPAFGVDYALGMDGIAMVMVLLTTFTTPLAILGSFNYIKKRQRAFYALMLLLETGMIGVFLATDLILFYVFFELTLVPMYFIVGVWGGDRRIYAAIKFLLVHRVWLAPHAGCDPVPLLPGPRPVRRRLVRVRRSAQPESDRPAAALPVLGLCAGVCDQGTDLPATHLAAGRSRRGADSGLGNPGRRAAEMGTYGFVRFLLPLFPDAAQHPTVVTIMMVVAVVGIIYAAWVAAVQPDAKKLVAYTSVAHMGFVVLGVFALTVNGIQGGLVVMVSHGVSTGALFLLLGMLYERRHTRAIADFGGLGRVAPWLATAFVVTALASIGLPGTSGFVGGVLGAAGGLRDPSGSRGHREHGSHLRSVLHASDGAASVLQQARKR